MGIGPLQEQLPAPQIAFSRVDRMEKTVRGGGDESIETCWPRAPNYLPESSAVLTHSFNCYHDQEGGEGPFRSPWVR